MNIHTGQLFVLACVLGIGLWACLSATPLFRRARLVDTIAPHLVDISEEARQHVARPANEPLPVIGTLLSPLMSRIQRILTETVGTNQAIARRLRQAGIHMAPERYRMQQAACALAGITGGLVLGSAMVVRGGAAWNLLLVAPITCGILAVAACDLRLRARANARIRRIASEFPSILEFMTLALAAGEGTLDAMRRIAELEHSELAREFAGVVREIHSGIPTDRALRTFARELGFIPLERTADHLITAMERGAPLTDVLHAQAADARVLEKRDLLERAGRNEIRMMFPLVLLILPVTVLFAVFPSFFVLTNTF